MARRLNTTQKTKDWAKRTPLKTEVNSDYTESVSSSCATNDTRHVILVEHPVTEIQNVIRNGSQSHVRVTIILLYMNRATM
jgi:hypothetical protein